MKTKAIFILFLSTVSITSSLKDFIICHDNFALDPEDGVLRERWFTWLAFVQYMHVTTGLPHHSKAPRVMLMHRQFVMGTATDLLHLPKNYKLGNVIFGHYERTEEDCKLTKSQIQIGIQCSLAYLEIPHISITPHPEFLRFGVGNSLALMKLIRPIQSSYMVPVCLPTYLNRKKIARKRVGALIDYISAVPRDFQTEMMGKKSVRIYTHKECRIHRLKSGLGSEGVTQVLCSSGCGVRNGAPLISHNKAGTFELIGVAASAPACDKKSHRNRLNKEPPIYIDVYPYVSWIVNVVTANVLPLAYPNNFKMVSSDDGSAFSVRLRTTEADREAKIKKEWMGHTFVASRSSSCMKHDKMTTKRFSKFYMEEFEVNSNPRGKMTIVMKISAGIDTTIKCVKLIMPNNLVTPDIQGVDRYNITVKFVTDWFPMTYRFQMALYGIASTVADKMKWLPERSAGFY